MSAQDAHSQLLCRIDGWLDSVAAAAQPLRVPRASVTSTKRPISAEKDSNVRNHHPRKRRRTGIPSPTPTSTSTSPPIVRAAPSTAMSTERRYDDSHGTDLNLNPNTAATAGNNAPSDRPQTPTPSSKRRRDLDKPPSDPDLDPDQTPKPPELFRLPSAPASVASTISSSSSARRSQASSSGGTGSGRGRKSSLSPKKQKINAEVSVYPIQNESLPRIQPGRFPQLEELDSKLWQVKNGENVVPSSLEAAARLRRKEAPSLFRWAEDGRCYYGEDHGEPDFMPIPELEWVESMLERALSIGDMDHDEGAWNMEVHQKILERAFRSPNGRDREQLVQFTSCITAGISPCYAVREPEGSQPVPTKKVDFVLHLNMDHSSEKEDPADAEAFDHLRKLLPNAALSHTDYAGLRRSPIALPIETKRTSEGYSAALLQLGVWQRAHFIFLERLQRMHAGHSVHDKIAIALGTSIPEPTADLVGLPEFVPGLVVTGHLWSVVFVTGARERSLRVWHKRDLGSTDDVLGIFKIFRGLHVLRRWIIDDYWPSVRKLYIKAAS